MTFYGLRAYGTAPQCWGGTPGLSAACDAGDHEWDEGQRTRRRGQAAGDTAQVGNTVKRVCPPELDQGTTCVRCGCWRGELGSEPTVNQWVAHLVEVCTAVKRVLRDDGLLWIECGDSYQYAGSDQRSRNLVLAPFQLALGLQQAGWTLRQVISLCRLAPMPESIGGTAWRRHRSKMRASAVSRRGDPSVNGGWPQHEQTIGDGAAAAEWQDCPGCDRCAATDGYVQSWGSGRATCATSYVLQLCKDGARYYYDQEGVREPHADARVVNGHFAGSGVNRPDYVPPAKDGLARTSFAMRDRAYSPAGRNRLNWQYWRPERDGSDLPHYAQFPPSIPKLAIDAAPLYVCPACAAPFARLVERQAMVVARSGWGERAGNRTATSGTMLAPPERQTLGWRPTCACPGVTLQTAARAVILDCFGGVATTALVADRLGRDGISIELSPAYHRLAEARVRGDAPLLLELAAEEVPAR